MANQNSTIIALDVGEKRIGVATTSLAARLPAPWGIISRGPQTFDDISELVNKQQAQALIIGLPRGLDGQDTAQTQHVRDFVVQLQKSCQLPIHLQDEALTSKKAQQELSDRGVDYTKGAIDALAATYILSDFLQEHPELIE